MSIENPVYPLAIDARKITKTFGKVTAVNQLSLEIQQGEIVALLGHNGAGKTTFLDVCLGLQDATSGEAKLYGMRSHEAVRRSLIGVMQQTGGLLTDYTVKGFLKNVAATHLTPLPMLDLLEIANLTHLANFRIGKLSGGERQRVAFATALIGNPQLLILDEPTSGMDAIARRDFWECMQSLAEQGKTIVFATHYLTEAENYAQRTVIMKDGQVIVDAPTRQIRADYETQHLTINLPTETAITVTEEVKTKFAAQLERIQLTDTTLECSGHDFDNLARFLLSQPGAHNLELTKSSLEDIYTQLVGAGSYA